MQRRPPGPPPPMPAPARRRRTPGEVCKRCGRDVVIGFSVADEVWSRVAGDWTILCAPCFDERAHELRVSYTFLGLFPCPWSIWTEDA